MSKYIKVFDTVEQYNAYSGGTAFTSPNISYIKNTDETKYDDNEIKHYTKDSWIEFDDSYILTNNYLNANNIIKGIRNLKSFDGYSGVTSISENAFYKCSSLRSIEIPSGVTSIGDYAFYQCSNLTSVTIPSGVTSIGNYTFQECSSLTSVTIPSGVTSIGNYTFQECSSLTSVTIPSGVTSIGNSAFLRCSSLRSIEIPSGVTSIRNYTFQECSSLTSITLNEGLEQIGDQAFRTRNFSISNLTIPSTVTSIGSGALSIPDAIPSSKYLDYIVCLATTPPILKDTWLNNCPTVIYVPNESVDAYKSASNWIVFGSKIKPISEKPNN